MPAGRKLLLLLFLLLLLLVKAQYDAMSCTCGLASGSNNGSSMAGTHLTSGLPTQQSLRR